MNSCAHIFRAAQCCVVFTLASMLIMVCGEYECFDLSPSAGVWSCVVTALCNKLCSDWLFYVCGHLGPFGHFSVSRWQRVLFHFDCEKGTTLPFLDIFQEELLTKITTEKLEYCIFLSFLRPRYRGSSFVDLIDPQLEVIYDEACLLVHQSHSGWPERCQATHGNQFG